MTTWLHRIVVNACLDRVRRRAARPVVALPADPAGSPADPADPADPIAAADTAMDVRAALAALPVDQRLAVVLVDIEGLPVAEAAAVLDVPEGTVKSRCARGRARLLTMLGPAHRPAGNRAGPGGVRPGGAPEHVETAGEG